MGAGNHIRDLILSETVAHIRDLDIFAICIIAAQLEDKSFYMRFYSLLGDLFHSLGNSIKKGKAEDLLPAVKTV